MATVRAYPHAKTQPCYLLDWTHPVTGKRSREYLYCTIDIAENVLEAKKAEIVLIKHGLLKTPELSSLTLTEAKQLFIKGKKGEIKQNTMKSYILAMDNLIEVMGDVNLSSMSRNDGQKFRLWLKNRFDTTTCNIRIRSVKAFLNWIITNTDHLDRLPFNLREFTDRETKNKFIHPDEFIEIKEATLCVNDNDSIYSNDLFVNLWDLYKETGMRLSEVFTLKIDGRFLNILGKYDKLRTVPMQTDIKPLYERVIPNLSGIDPTYISNRFSLVCGAIGYEYTVHSLRHTFACEMLAKYDGSIWKVSELLGHSKLETTQGYLRSFPLEYLQQIFA